MNRTSQTRNGPAGEEPIRERITLLTGRNTPARNSRLRQLVEEWTDKDWLEFNVTEADAGDIRPADLLMILAQVSVGDPHKHRIVVLTGVERLRASEAEALAAILPRTPVHSRLLLVADGDRAGRESKVSAKLVKMVETEGRVLDFPPLRAGEVPSFIATRAREMGLRMLPEAIRAMVTRVGPDAAMIERELEKLSTAVESNDGVTPAMVREMVPPSLESSVFEMTDAVGERDPEKALRALQSLFASGQTAYLLLPMVARQLRLIWQIKAAAEGLDNAGLKDPGIARLADWQRQKLQRHSRSFQWEALEHGMKLICQADLAMKGIEDGGEEPRLLLESILLRLCGGVGGERAIQTLHQA